MAIRLPKVRLHAFEKALDRLEADMNRPAKKTPPGPPPTKAQLRAIKALTDELVQRVAKVKRKRAKTQAHLDKLKERYSQITLKGPRPSAKLVKQIVQTSSPSKPKKKSPR